MGLAHINTSILQKYAFLCKKSAARGVILPKMTATAGVWIGPIPFYGLFRQHPCFYGVEKSYKFPRGTMWQIGVFMWKRSKFGTILRDLGV